MTAIAIPRAFVWRRLHSLMGLWIVLFLMEHLLTNSQAALWIGEDGKGFVKMVNALHNLPYLQAIELTLLGVPLLIHMFWGLKYLFTAKSNSSKSDGSKPHLPLSRNRAYSWQRITSWILLIGIIGHVAKFRFIDYPEQVHLLDKTVYLTKVSPDTGIYTLADRLHVQLYDEQAISREEKALLGRSSEKTLVEAARKMQEQSYDFSQGPITQSYDSQRAIILTSSQKYESDLHWVTALKKMDPGAGEVVAVSSDFGTASLLNVRETFKSPIYVGLYTIFVLAACFHGFNGMWTFLITWGLVLKMSAQRTWVGITTALMLLVIFLGLASIWGTYWINLKY